eukprot:GAFH01001367.1.p2 GENE.GAFH01001367.1~~GAFH01001367.1.p2  ORF type:complete len:169 (+),score=31.84 GAFH01001367.1:411-917(+)
MSDEGADEGAFMQVPQAHTPVGASRGQVERVRVEAQAVDVGDMAREEAQRSQPVGGPQAGRAVVATGGEVVVGWGEGAVPQGRLVAAVRGDGRLGLQRPQPRGAVLGAAQGELAVVGEDRPVDGPRVAPVDLVVGVRGLAVQGGVGARLGGHGGRRERGGCRRGGGGP